MQYIIISINITSYINRDFMVEALHLKVCIGIYAIFFCKETIYLIYLKGVSGV